jgi:hypothetical protein
MWTPAFLLLLLLLLLRVVVAVHGRRTLGVSRTARGTIRAPTATPRTGPCADAATRCLCLCRCCCLFSSPCLDCLPCYYRWHRGQGAAHATTTPPLIDRAPSRMCVVEGRRLRVDDASGRCILRRATPLRPRRDRSDRDVPQVSVFAMLQVAHTGSGSRNAGGPRVKARAWSCECAAWWRAHFCGLWPLRPGTRRTPSPMARGVRRCLSHDA